MVDFDLSGMTGTFAKWLSSGLFWTVAIVILCGIIFFFYAFMSKRGKLKYNCIEVIRFGNGKVGLNLMKAGIFKSKSMMKGLVDYGTENIYKTSDGRKIQQARESYLHDVFGKKGFIVYRKTGDPKVLVPIQKFQFDNLNVLLEIAPVDYRDTSTNIVKDTIKETTGTWEKILPFIAIGVVVMLCIISIIINQQMTNNTIDKVGKLLIQGCQNVQNVAPSGVAP